MRLVFADSSYWIALVNPDDDLHEKACQLSAEVNDAAIVTSEMVLTEVVNHHSRPRMSLRRAAIRVVESIRDGSKCHVVPQTSAQFSDALRFFKQREDKQWSLTDCASILIMQEEGIQEVLTYDSHFTQAGFTALLRPKT